MAKKKGRPAKLPPESAPPDLPAKRRQVHLDEDLHRKASFIAKALGLTLPDWVNNRLRPIIEEELPATLRAQGFIDK